MIYKYLLGFVFMVAVLVRAQYAFNMGWLLAGLASSVLSWPPFIYGSELRCDRTAPFLCWIIFWTSYLDAAVFAVLLVMREKEWVDGDTMTLWVEITRAAGHALFLPIYFTFVSRPENEEEEEEDDGHPLHIDLPGGMVVHARNGSWMDTVVRTRKLRECMGSICIFYLTVASTVMTVSNAYRLGLVEADTSLVFLSVCAAVSMAYCVPLFTCPGLNTRLYSTVLYYVLLPVAVATTYHMWENGVWERESILDFTTGVRISTTFGVVVSFYIVAKRRLEAAKGRVEPENEIVESANGGVERAPVEMEEPDMVETEESDFYEAEN